MSDKHETPKPANIKLAEAQLALDERALSDENDIPADMRALVETRAEANRAVIAEYTKSAADKLANENPRHANGNRSLVRRLCRMVSRPLLQASS